jgi:hypothetical protein
MEEGKNNGRAQFDAIESPSMYIRMRVLPWGTFVSVGQVGIISAPFEPASRLLVQLNVWEYGR